MLCSNASSGSLTPPSIEKRSKQYRNVVETLSKSYLSKYKSRFLGLHRNMIETYHRTISVSIMQISKPKKNYRNVYYLIMEHRITFCFDVRFDNMYIEMLSKSSDHCNCVSPLARYLSPETNVGQQIRNMSRLNTATVV